MEKNVGNFDANVRITAGLSFLGLGILKGSKPMIYLGAMKVAAGITRFCPILYLLDISTTKFDSNIRSAMNNIKNQGSLEEFLEDEI